MADITTINGGDSVASSRTTINTNFANLNVARKYLVASSTAPDATKAIAAYVCTAASSGTTDDVQIKAAWDAAGVSGGEVILSEGTFNCYHTIAPTTLANASNTAIRGKGKGITILKAMVNNISILAAGTGDASNGTVPSNLTFSDFTVDMNNTTGAAYGMAIACCKDVVMENIHIKNQKNGAKSMLFFGANSNASSAFVPRNLTVINSIFSDSDAQWEAVTLAQALNCKFINCTFRDKTSIYSFLNYSSYDVALTNCQFISCNNGVNGKGYTTFNNCQFKSASVTVQAWNTTFNGCTFQALDGAYSGSIKYIGFQLGSSEVGWDSSPNEVITLKNNKIINCSFDHCNTASITSGTFLGNDAITYYPDCDDLLISGCHFINTYWRGIDVQANYLTVRDCEVVNSDQLTGSSNAHNYGIGGGTVRFVNNISIDNQGSPTVTYDTMVDRQTQTAAVWPTTNIYYKDNNFSLIFFVCYNGSFTTTPPSGLNLYGTNNIGVNPDYVYAQGNVTGATTFNRINGSSITATLTGNITVTLTAGKLLNDELSLILTQDGTGSRTVTWPSNFKKAGGSLVLSTGASAVDIIKMRWDGTNWREVSRALNQS